MALVQLVYAQELTGVCDYQSFMQHETLWGWGAFDQNVCLQKLQQVQRMWNEVDRMIADIKSPRWRWERMCVVLRSIIRCAVTELIAERVPLGIIVKEYTSILHAFYGDCKEIHFLRFILNRLDDTDTATQTPHSSSSNSNSKSD